MIETSSPPILSPAIWLSAFGAWGVIWLLGWAIARAIRLNRSLPEHAAITFALGLAVTPVFVLLAGQVNGLILQRSFWVPLSLAGWGLAVGILRENAGRWKDEWALRADALDAGGRAGRLLGLAGWMAVALTLLLLLGSAFSPPINYDTLEYHMAAPAYSMRMGRVEPIPHVFYSAQPTAVEMLYLLGMIFEGTARGLAAGLIHWSLVVACAWMFAALLARAVRSQPVRPWAVLLFLAHPIVRRVEIDRLTDIGGALFLFAGLTAIFHDDSDREDSLEPGLALAAGIFAAGAISVKWTNAGTAALILCLTAMWGSSRSLDRGVKQLEFKWAAKVWSRRMLPFVAGLFLLLAPWLVWLSIVAGSPFAPFFPGLTDGENPWRSENLSYLLESHGMRGMFDPAYWRHAIDSIRPMGFGLPIIPALVLLLAVAAAPGLKALVARRKGATGGESFLLSGEWPILLGCLFGWLAWARLEQAQVRFLVPVFGAQIFVLALLWDRVVVSRGSLRFFVRGAAAMAFAAASIPWWLGVMSPAEMPPYWDHALGRIGSEEYLAKGLGATERLFRAANELPRGARIFAVSEARGYYIHPRITLTSVFDRNPMLRQLAESESPQGLEERLASRGFTHLLVNEYEMARLLLFHPPPGVANNTDYAAFRVRGMDGANLSALARRFAGWGEFGAAQPTAEKREIYLKFLEMMRGKAIFMMGDGERMPRMWIAPIGPQ